MMALEAGNALSENALALVQDAISIGPVFGFHMFYYGGQSGSSFVFTSFEEYFSYVAASRAGDLFLIWSTAELNEAGKTLTEPPVDGKVPDWKAKAIKNVANYFAAKKENEAFIIYGSSETLKSTIMDYGWLLEFEELIKSCSDDDYFAVYPFTDVDSEEYYLLKAKRPDAQGNIPIGGAY